MLAPKRVKFRKMMKGRTKGFATRGNTVAFGQFGLMATEPGTVDRCPHQLRRRFERVAAVGLGDSSEATPGRELRAPQRLCEPHVPDPGDDGLVEQRLAEPARLVRGT